MVCDAEEDVAEVGFGIAAVYLGSPDQREDACGTRAALVGASEASVLAAEGDGADGALGGVVVDLDGAVPEIALEGRPSCERVADRQRSGGLARKTGELLLKPGPETGYDRPGFMPAHPLSLLGRAPRMRFSIL